MTISSSALDRHPCDFCAEEFESDINVSFCTDFCEASYINLRRPRISTKRAATIKRNQELRDTQYAAMLATRSQLYMYYSQTTNVTTNLGGWIGGILGGTPTSS